MIKNIVLLLVITFNIKFILSDTFGYGSSLLNSFSGFDMGQVNGFISNDLSHEIFLELPNEGNYEDYDSYESNIFFIIGKEKIYSIDFTFGGVNINPIGGSYNDLYSISSSYLYIPKYYLSSGSINSVLFGFCTDTNFISSYIFDFNNKELTLKDFIPYEDLDINKNNKNNKCSGSSFISQKDFGNRIYISNAYSLYSNDNQVRNLHYIIKIFEFRVSSLKFDNYVGKSFNVEIINYSTTQPGNFNTNILSKLEILFNTDGVSLIKCKIINSFINKFQDDIYYYDKEIILLCLYYSKDLINSRENEPRLAIRLDLFKNTLGSNELQLISGITIKNNIIIDIQRYDILNYVYPSLINFKSENEIYIVLKGQKYSEIYSVEINIDTLILSNVKILENFGFTNYETNTGLILKTNNLGHISFTTREFIGSFYIVKFYSGTNIVSIYLYGDKNKNNYQETEILLNIRTIGIPSTTYIRRIEISSISNVLLGILFVSDNQDTEYAIFLQYPMCDQKSKYRAQISTNPNPPMSINALIPSLLDSDYSEIFGYTNSITDKISNDNSKNYGKIEFNETYLTPSEKDEYLNIAYSNDNKELILTGIKNIKNVQIFYNVYYEESGVARPNKYYSTTCSFYVDVCHDFCQTCSSFSSDDLNTECIECLSPNYFPLYDDTSICKNKNEILNEGYYYSEEDQNFQPCHPECEYCIGPNDNDCLKCADNTKYLLESGLRKINKNSKIYEYSNCITCEVENYYYTSNNFDDGSVRVCLDLSVLSCPEDYPFLENNICYQNCKNSGTVNIYGSQRNGYCVDECDTYYYYENNICTQSCPENYYLYELEHYCIEKCINSLYHVKIERRNYDNEIYFELYCKTACPIETMPYSFIDENNNKYCLSTCSQFSFYFSEYETLYNIYYKNTLICRSKEQCNKFSDEYSRKKYVALIKETSISGEITEKRVCVTECKEVNQYLLPQSLIDIENTKAEGVDCTEECPEPYANNSWTCTECSSIYKREYEKNCIEEDCPDNSFKIDSKPYKCFSSCPDDYPYQDNFGHKCYKTLAEVPRHEEEFGDHCDKTKHLWYKIYNVNNVPIIKCLSDTDVYLTCDAVILEYNFTNKANHECVQSCPTSYTIKNEHTRFCDLDTNSNVDFDEIRETLLTHELIDNETKNESNLIIYERDYNSENTISFYLFNYSNILEKILNNIEPEVETQETNGDIRKDPTAPFYYPNGTEIIISDQCEDLLRKSYNIPYYNTYYYIETVSNYSNGIKQTFNETKEYYIPQYLLGIIMNIKRDNTSQVEYKFYNPKNPSVELDLSLCHEVEDDKTNKVTINIERDLKQYIYDIFYEVTSYYSNNKGKYLDKYVYDIFDRKSDFFIDPCTPFTSKYGSDVLIVDRYKDYYVRIDFCENNCTDLGSRKS